MIIIIMGTGKCVLCILSLLYTFQSVRLSTGYLQVISPCIPVNCHVDVQIPGLQVIPDGVAPVLSRPTFAYAFSTAGLMMMTM